MSEQITDREVLIGAVKPMLDDARRRHRMVMMSFPSWEGELGPVETCAAEYGFVWPCPTVRLLDAIDAACEADR